MSWLGETLRGVGVFDELVIAKGLYPGSGVPPVTVLIGTCPMTIGTFFLTVLGIRRANHQPATPDAAHITAVPAELPGHDRDKPGRISRCRAFILCRHIRG